MRDIVNPRSAYNTLRRTSAPFVDATQSIAFLNQSDAISFPSIQQDFEATNDPASFTWAYSSTDAAHCARRLRATNADDVDLIIYDLERAVFHRDDDARYEVSFENPDIGYRTLVSASAELSHDQRVVIDGGLGRQWWLVDPTPEQAKSWLVDAAQWSTLISVTRAVSASHYPWSNHDIYDWCRRLANWCTLVRATFGFDTCILVTLWHRYQDTREWVSQDEYTNMAEWTMRCGAVPVAFGREESDEEFARAQEYVNIALPL